MECPRDMGHRTEYLWVGSHIHSYIIPIWNEQFILKCGPAFMRWSLLSSSDNNNNIKRPFFAFISPEKGN